MVLARIILLLTVAPLIVSCFVFHCAPYKCREAVEGRTLYRPVLVAIEKYREQYGSYPGQLADLSPWLPGGIPASVHDDGPKFPEYERNGDTFQFSFQYYGPGINMCTYSPESDWRCDGHY